VSEIAPNGVTVIGVALECPNCGHETRHEIHYVARLLHRMECESCGHRWDVNHSWLRHRYLLGFPSRIVSKPVRLAREARSQPIAFALSIPGRVFSKPARVAGEVGTVAGILDE
jgi:predicted RNA-binding Zn-ribbon protein involved in translation (DUF1610 family)